jgi:hypothetical protein
MLTVEGNRLVTLTGSGGIGKTRLAIAAAREVETVVPRRRVFVDLAPVLDPALVTAAVARALGVVDDGAGPIGDDLVPALATAACSWCSTTSSRSSDAAPELAASSAHRPSRCSPRAGSCSGSAASTASPSAHLDPAAATDLLVDRARAVKPDFELTDQNSADITAICRPLDNAPLALELAAARLRVLTPAALAERLDHALSVLHHRRPRPPRAPAHAPRDHRVERTAPATGRNGSCCCGSACSAPGSASMRPSGWPRASRHRGGRRRRRARRARRREPRARAGPWGRAWFTMLATVREYGREQQKQRGVLGEMEERHARF